MKKGVLFLLACSLFVGSVPTYAASTETVVSEDWAAMANLGLMVNETGTTYAKKQVTKNQVRAILLQFNLPESESLSELLESLNSDESISEKVFYEIFLGLLGYEKGVDFTEGTVIAFAKSIGLHPSNGNKFTHEDLARALNDCLKSKNKAGREFFEVLLDYGFLSDYNKDKDVPEILVFDGKTQPIFNNDEVIYERVYVETPLDTDLDNKLDLVEVWIKRPAETEEGMKVPVVFEYSPYERGTNDDLYSLHNVDEDLAVSPANDLTLEDIKYVPTEKELPAARTVKGEAETGHLEPFDFTGWYDYFLVRGYAVVSAGGLGTAGSEGMVLTGSDDEITAGVAIIDWLNGRAKAFTNKTDNIEVKADWCTGSVGMSGRSYRGTLPIGVAATGVEGLETIVPIAAISNWYDYYRANGLNLAGEGWQGDDIDILSIYCMSRMFDSADYATVKSTFERAMEQMFIEQDRVSGDYNTFWDERNYLNNADQIEASVFIVHGLSDWNVKTKQFDMLWKALEKYDVPRKMVLHQGEHISINNLAGIDFNDMMNSWFAYWLYDIENNVMKEIAPVTIQNTNTLEFETFENWGEEKNITKFYLGENTKGGTLNTKPSKDEITHTFVDDLTLSGYDRANPNPLAWRHTIVQSPETVRPDRLAYVTTPLEKEMRINGTVKVSLKVALDQPTCIISAMLVDYGSDYRPTIETEVVVPNGIIYGANGGSDDIVNFVREKEKSDYKIISRGWMDAQNRVADYRVDAITPTEEYTFTIDMQPMDYVVKKGHQLGLILYSTDAEYTMRPLSVTNFTVDADETFVEIPVLK